VTPPAAHRPPITPATGPSGPSTPNAPSLGQLGSTRKTERTRLQGDYDRTLRVVAEIDAANTVDEESA